MTGRSEKVTFPGADGVMLAGRLDWPLGTPRAFALFAHCFTCSKDIFAASRVAQAWRHAGSRYYGSTSPAWAQAKASSRIPTFHPMPAIWSQLLRFYGRRMTRRSCWLDIHWAVQRF